VKSFQQFIRMNFLRKSCKINCNKQKQRNGIFKTHLFQFLPFKSKNLIELQRKKPRDNSRSFQPFRRWFNPTKQIINSEPKRIVFRKLKQAQNFDVQINT